jgi:hypothetical protein
MRITVRIDDELHRELKERAREEGSTLGETFNRIVRLGYQAFQHDRENAGNSPKGKPSCIEKARD